MSETISLEVEYLEAVDILLAVQFFASAAGLRGIIGVEDGFLDLYRKILPVVRKFQEDRGLPLANDPVYASGVDPQDT